MTMQSERRQVPGSLELDQASPQACLQERCDEYQVR
jgi:hypothetical protein